MIFHQVHFLLLCRHFFSPALKISSPGRCSGGVIVLVKNYLKDNVIELNSKLSNCITLKFINIFLNEVIGIFPYIPCSTSPYYNNLASKDGIALLHCHLNDIINSNNSNNSVIILGDLISPISDIQPIHECDIASKYLDDVNGTDIFS